jgi:hypothetical protein
MDLLMHPNGITDSATHNYSHVGRTGVPVIFQCNKNLTGLEERTFGQKVGIVVYPVETPR